MIIGERVTNIFMHRLAWRRFCIASGLAATFLMWAGASSAAAAAATMASHRAYYDVRLGTAAQGGGIVAAKGVMSVEGRRILDDQLEKEVKSCGASVVAGGCRLGEKPLRPQPARA